MHPCAGRHLGARSASRGGYGPRGRDYDVGFGRLLRDLGLRPQEPVALRRGSLDRDRREVIIEETKSKKGRLKGYLASRKSEDDE